MALMGARNTSDGFGWVTRLAHWSLAISMLFLGWLGGAVVDLSYYDPLYNKALSLHDALGTLVGVVGLALVVWSLTNVRPTYPPGMSVWARTAARSAHVVLYGFILVLPITGYLPPTASGDGVDLFGLVEIPALFKVTEGARDWVIQIHWYLAYGLPMLVLVHALAAAKHQWIERDGTLARMVFGHTGRGGSDS